MCFKLLRAHTTYTLKGPRAFSKGAKTDKQISFNNTSQLLYWLTNIVQILITCVIKYTGNNTSKAILINCQREMVYQYQTEVSLQKS